MLKIQNLVQKNKNNETSARLKIQRLEASAVTYRLKIHRLEASAVTDRRSATCYYNTVSRLNTEKSQLAQQFKDYTQRKNAADSQIHYGRMNHYFHQQQKKDPFFEFLKGHLKM